MGGKDYCEGKKREENEKEGKKHDGEELGVCDVKL